MTSPSGAHDDGRVIADGAPLPPPPPVASPAATVRPTPAARPGDTTVGWRIVLATTWIAVIVALVAVWNASVQLGLSTWWLGPRGDPRPRPVQLSIFVAPVLVVLATVNRVRYLAWWGIAGSLAVAAFGLGDLGRVTSIAIVELLIAAAAATASLAALSGTYRADARTTAGGDGAN